MSATTPIRVAILGAGRGGSALLELLHQIPNIRIVGIADRDGNAPGLQRARELDVPVIERAEALIEDRDVNLIMDVTGDPEMDGFIRRHKRPGADILSGSASRVLWELVRHEAKLQAELFHAEKLAGIGSFAAGIAHDINNPLQLILGLAENLTEEKDPAAIQEQARDIIEAVRRTSAICRDLTRYARRSPDRDEVVALHGRLEEALKIARYATGLYDIAVVKHYDGDARAIGNPDEFLHVFVNLITNAVHAMEQTRGDRTLTLVVERADGRARVVIGDTGCGMAPQTLNRIFEPFFTTKSPGKGTGLGLYNVKTIMNKLHGAVTVESRIDQGTTFTLSFPPPEEVPP